MFTQRRKKNSVKTSLILGVFCGLVFSLALVVFSLTMFSPAAKAVSIDPGLGQTFGLGTADLFDVVIRVVQWILGLLGLIAVIIMMYGGIIWMTSGGNEEKIAKAKRILINGVIGLAIILLAWAIVLFIVRVIGDATGGGGSGCNPDCSIYGPTYTCCSDLVCREDCGSGPGGFEDVFAIRSITTSCPVQSEPHNGVNRCSRVALNFNVPVNRDSAKAAFDVGKLKVEKCVGANELVDGCNDPQVLNLPPALDNQVFTSGCTAADPVGASEWLACNKSVIFYHDNAGEGEDAFFEPFTVYRVSISEDVTSNDHLPITECETIDGHPLAYCEYNGLDELWTWMFKTSDQLDEIPPVVDSTYPVDDAQPAYPDRYVNRVAILTANFSESIDPLTVNEDNVILTPFDPNDPPTAPNWDNGTLLAPLEKKLYRVNLDANGDGLQVSLENNPKVCVGGDNPNTPCPNGDECTGGGTCEEVTLPNYLDAYTWYQIKLQDVEDMCGNIMDPSPKTWVFQTNGVVPNISWYPQIEGVCPDIDVFFQFSVSMYDPDNMECVVGGGYVTGGNMQPDWPRGPTPWLIDECPGSCENPNKYCKRYGWDYDTVPNDLTVNQGYDISIETRYLVDGEGNTLRHEAGGDLEFVTGEPGSCVYPPWVSSLDPYQGPEGQCLTVRGEHFEAEIAVPEKPVVHIGSPQSEVPDEGWDDNSLVTIVPSGYVPKNTEYPVTVTVDWGDPWGELTSIIHEDSEFYVRDESPYLGPCLYAINPDEGRAQFSVKLSGDRLEPEPASDLEGGIHFTGANVDFGDWTWGDTSIKTNVPENTTIGNYPVFISNLNGNSNSKDFNMLPGDPNTPYVIESTRCNDTEFSSPFPYKDAENVCLNVWVSARFSHSMDTATLDEPAGVNNVVFNRCTDETCTAYEERGIAGERGVFTFSQANDSVWFAPTLDLAPNKYYQMVLTTGIESAEGYPLETDYSWIFHTKNEAGPCPLEGITISPGSHTINGEFQTQGYEGWPYGEGCQYFDPDDYVWSWRSTDTDIATVDDVSTYQTTAFSLDREGTTQICGSVPSESVEGCGTLKADFTYCEDNYHCTKCDSDSLCINNRCTPIIQSVNPGNGDIGRFITISGCFFGAYEEGTSKVVFTNNKEAVFPDPQYCGDPEDLWRNSQIIVEVPNDNTIETSDDAIDGHIYLETKYGDQDYTDDAAGPDIPDFDVDNTVSPNLCKIEPNRANPLSADIIASGEAFGSAAGRVEYQKEGGRTNATIDTWGDNAIKHSVPSDAILSTSADGVTVWQGGVESNPVNFYVSCHENANCATGCCYGGNCRETATCSEGGPGELCDDVGADCDYGPERCVDKYECLTRGWRDCRCCCTPGTEWGKLTCLADKDDCTGADRGLFCGCETDADCGFPNTIGCGQENCCYERPLIESTVPADLETDVCLNRVMEVYFDRLMDSSTFNSDNVILEYWNSGSSCIPPEAKGSDKGYFAQAWNYVKSLFINKAQAGIWCPLDIEFSSRREGDTTVMIIEPEEGVLPADSDIKVTIKTDPNINDGNPEGVLSSYGVGVDGSTTGGEYTFTFTTSNVLCELDHVDVFVETALSSVESYFDLYTCNNDQCEEDLNSTAAGNQHRYVAQARDENDQAIFAVYNWKDTNNPDNVVNLDDPGDQDTHVTSDFSVPHSDGTEYAETEVDAGEAGKMTVSVLATVDICEKPWPVTPPYNYPFSFNPPQVEPTNFLTYFCQDGLPENLSVDYLDEPGNAVNGVDPEDQIDELLREVFFKVENNGEDAGVIGIRIYENELRVPPRDWYENKFSESPGGSSKTVDGYQALAAGRTTYVAAANSADELYLNIYLMSYSDEAASETKNIYNQMIENWYFNTNIDADDKPALVNDTYRVMDLGGIADALIEYYDSHDIYPYFISGTFVEGMTTSKWPSWQAQAGNELGFTLPEDPVNMFGDCGTNYDPETCWNETERLYYCPLSGSHIYQYMSEGNGTKAYLYANLEYTGDPHWQNYDGGDPCTSPHRCDCFDYQLDSEDSFVGGTSTPYAD